MSAKKDIKLRNTKTIEGLNIFVKTAEAIFYAVSTMKASCRFCI